MGQIHQGNLGRIGLRLYYEIETRAKFVMLAYGYTIPAANNANFVIMRSNGLCNTLLEHQKHAEVSRTSDNWQLSPTNYNVVNFNYNN